MHAVVGNEPIWKLERVWLGRSRLRDVTLEIRAGVTALIGWSGAGKTSLLNLLVGFEEAGQGTVWCGATAVAWVPQNSGLWPHCTAREHLEMVQRADNPQADALLVAFDLLERAEARPDELSEGEQSRLSIARALAMEARVLVMDEPLVHVDPARVGKYWRVIRDYVAKTSGSLVFSTHLPEMVLGEAEQVICLREGCVLHQGPVANLYAKPPNPELMNFLGPGNWLTPEECRFWLGASDQPAQCYRPEQLRIEMLANSTLRVEAVRFYGSVGWLRVRDSSTERQREFYHRPVGPILQPDMGISISIAR